jgi:hypothetical protein
MRKKAAKSNIIQLAEFKVKEVWLNPNILTWDASVESSSVNQRNEWMRAHELWLHADNRLKKGVTREDRADVIGVLRRVLNHRLKKLKAIYLDNLPIIKKPAGTIERLALIGVIKPLMLHKLLEIRNAIEYQDTRPPNERQCAELLEFMWYFLRSTDGLIRLVAESISFQKLNKQGEETPYGFTLETGPPEKWKNRIHGWFETKSVSLPTKPNWLKVEIETIHTKLGFGNKSNGIHHDDKKDDDIWIVGKFASASHFEHLCHLYFIASLT